MAGGGYVCQPMAACVSPENQTVDENVSWTQYGSGEYERPPLFSICGNKAAHYIQIFIGGIWVGCSADTPIARIAGGYPYFEYLKQRGTPCNAANAPHAIWTLKSLIGSGGQTYSMRVLVQGTVVLHTALFTITVNAPAPSFIPRINKFNRKRSWDNEL